MTSVLKLLSAALLIASSVCYADALTPVPPRPFSCDTHHYLIALDKLTLVAPKGHGMNPGGVYRDAEGVLWFVKETDGIVEEFVTSRLLGLLTHRNSAEVRLVSDRQGMVASRAIGGFEQAADCDLTGKIVLDKVTLTVAMDFLCLCDRHRYNQGYVPLGDEQLVYARVDYDMGLSFDRLDGKPMTLTIDDFSELSELVDTLRLLESIPNDYFAYFVDEALAVVQPYDGSYRPERYAMFREKLLERKLQVAGLIDRLQPLRIFLERSAAADAVRIAGLYQEMKTDLEQAITSVFHDTDGSLVHHAARGNRPELLRGLILAGVDVDQTTPFFNETPLLCAVQRNAADAAICLLDAGADASAADAFGNTPLVIAVTKGNIDLIDKLTLVHQDETPRHLFRHALSAENAHELIPRYWERWGGEKLSQNALDSLVRDALARVASPATLRMLLDKGGNLGPSNVDDQYGYSLLHMFCSREIRGNQRAEALEILQLLLDAGQDVNQPDDIEQTPLYKLIAFGQPLDLIQALIEAGADIHAEIDGETPLAVARDYYRNDVVRLLEELGAMK